MEVRGWDHTCSVMITAGGMLQLCWFVISKQSKALVTYTAVAWAFIHEISALHRGSLLNSGPCVLENDEYASRHSLDSGGSTYTRVLWLLFQPQRRGVDLYQRQGVDLYQRQGVDLYACIYSQLEHIVTQNFPVLGNALQDDMFKQQCSLLVTTHMCSLIKSCFTMILSVMF